MKFPKLFLFTIASLAVPLTAHCEDKVAGTFTVKGKTTAFHYVYAFWKP
jgi:hypothetical protein